MRPSWSGWRQSSRGSCWSPAETSTRPGALPALGGLDPASRAELVYELIEALRNRRVAPSGVEDPAVRAAADALHTALVEAAPPGPDADAIGPVPPPASAPVEDLLAAADAWSSWQRGIVAWREDAIARLEAIDREIEQVDAGDRPAGDPVAEWAELESALDSALDRLGAAQERVRAHEAATAEVAQLREAELDLRSRERPLLAAIAAAEAAPAASSDPASATPTTGPSDVPGAQAFDRPERRGRDHLDRRRRRAGRALGAAAPPRPAASRVLRGVAAAARDRCRAQRVP